METTSASDRRPVPHDPSLLPDGSRSLALIALQSFAMGGLVFFNLVVAALMAYNGWRWWPVHAYWTCLGVFHFLEFWTTARYNLPAARASSFLLYSNGQAYHFAQALSSTEALMSTNFPAYQSWLVGPVTVAVGIAFVVVGQVIRSVAMAQAGTNFNHIVARERREDHVLVTTGVYEYIRHPSYFGFFYWALGTQLVAGNKLCLVAFAVVLWKFFHSRIKAEERYLTQFFGDDYVQYRKKTPTLIPFIV